MEKAFKRYTIKAKNLYPVVAVLLHLRVPFEYIPKKKCGMKNYPTMRKTSKIEISCYEQKIAELKAKLNQYGK